MKWKCEACSRLGPKLSRRRASQWRHNGHVGVSDHRRLDCLPNCFFRHGSKKNIKAPRHWPLWGESISDRWIPPTKGKLRRKCFHLMTSSRWRQAWWLAHDQGDRQNMRLAILWTDDDPVYWRIRVTRLQWEYVKSMMATKLSTHL